MAGATDRDITGVAGQLHELLLNTDDGEQFLHEVAVLAGRSVSPGASCGITVCWDDWPMTVASSDALAATVDEVQYDHGSGPCLSSLHGGRTHEISDVTTDRRWSAYCARARSHGVRSSLSVPLRVKAELVGAINLYSTHSRAFGDRARRRARRFAEEVGPAVALAMRLSRQSELARDLSASLESRAVIDQAIGVIMSQNRCGGAEAFELLRRASNNRNVKLRDIATEIVTAVSGEPPTHGRRFVT